MLERRDTGEPMHVRTCTYFLLQSANSISSHGNYSRAASISFRACSGVATIRERRLFEREASIWSYTVYVGFYRILENSRGASVEVQQLPYQEHSTTIWKPLP